MHFPRALQRERFTCRETGQAVVPTEGGNEAAFEKGSALLIRAVLKVDLPRCERFFKGLLHPNDVEIFKGAASSICKSSKGELHNNKKTLKGKAVTQRCKNLCQGQLLCDLKVLQSGNHLKQCKFSQCMGNHWVRTLPCVIFKVAVSAHLKIF